MKLYEIFGHDKIKPNYVYAMDQAEAERIWLAYYPTFRIRSCRVITHSGFII